MCRVVFLMIGFASFFVPALVSANAIEDPTRPPNIKAYAKPEQRSSAPKLNSILLSQGRRLAVIDNQVITEGASTGSLTLLSVNADAVVVKLADDQRLTLTLGSKNIRKESK